jgi:hypothetical protein
VPNRPKRDPSAGDGHDPALGVQAIARQLVLGATEGFAAAQVAAFVAGWQAALELLARTDVTMPHGSEELRRAIAQLVADLDAATRDALEDPDEEPTPPA